MSTTASDPLREQIESSLRELAEAASGAPCALWRRFRRAVAVPVELGRTMVNLTTVNLLGWQADRSGAGATGVRPSTVSDSVSERRRDARGPGEPAGDATATSAAAPRLPIADYEHLPASNIVARLDRLDEFELAEIREFELANRGRRTVVGRIDQLLAT